MIGWHDLAAELPDGAVIAADGAIELSFTDDDERVTVRVFPGPPLVALAPTARLGGATIELRPRPDETPVAPGAAAGEAALRCATRYQIDTSDPSIADLWLDDVAVDALWPPWPHCRFTVADGEVRAAWDGVPRMRDARRGVVAAARLAGRATRLARAWRAIAAELGGAVIGARWDLAPDFAVHLTRDGVDLRLETAVDPRALAVRSRLTARLAGPPPEDLVRAVDERVDLGGADLVLDDAATLWWPAGPVDPAILRAAIDVLVRLAAPPAGASPYR